MREQSQPRPLCAYCGEKPGTEKGHVISKALFAKPRPQLLTVPACGKCNRGLAKYESAFRDMLAFDFRTNRHPTADALTKDTVFRAVQRNQSEVMKAFLNQSQRVALHTKSGLYIGNYRRLALDDKWVRYVLEMMVRGLYYHHFQRCIPRGHLVKIHLLDSQKMDIVLANFKRESIQLQGPYSLGDGVCDWAFLVLGEGASVNTVWVLSFYDGFFVAVDTRPVNGSELSVV